MGQMRGLGLALLAASLLALPSASVLAWPGTAAAQTGPGNPLSPGLPQGGGTTTTTATSPALPAPQTTTTAGGGGLSGGGAIAIAIGALVILGGISWFIWRDARRRAPVRARSGGPEVTGGARSGSKARAKPRKLSPAERKRRKRGRAR